MNEDMLAKYAPKLLSGNNAIGNPGDTGTGIMMGMSVGAAAINMHEGFISLPYYPPASNHKRHSRSTTRASDSSTRMSTTHGWGKLY